MGWEVLPDLIVRIVCFCLPPPPVSRGSHRRRDGAGLLEIFWNVNWPCFHTSLLFNQRFMTLIFLTIPSPSMSCLRARFWHQSKVGHSRHCHGWCDVRVESLGRRGHNFIFYSSSLILRSWISQRNKTFQTLIRNHCVIFLSEGKNKHKIVLLKMWKDRGWRPPENLFNFVSYLPLTKSQG